MKTYVLYHGNCYDGFAAAWVAWKYYSKDCEFFPVLYGNPLPEIEDGARVFILDFSYHREQLISLASRCTVTVLDHHKSAEADLKGLHFCRFDMNKSGAMLAWEYFCLPDLTTGPPRLIEYIQDRDLWKFELPESMEVSIALRACPFDFDIWDGLMQESNFKHLVRDGIAMKKLQDQFVEIMCKQAVFANVGGHSVPCVNATIAFSECGDYLCKKFKDAPFSAYYLDRSDGNRQWGLRSRGDFDVSEIAKLYGGGGHKAAAGFVQPLTQIDPIMPST